MSPHAADAVEARIVYWGIPGAGKTANLRTIHSKLKADNRGELSEIPTRLDPTVTYETLPIELGEVRGRPTRLQVIAVPGAPEQAPTRKQLLDEVDGIVLVIDSQRERADDNLSSIDELRHALTDYGRSLEELPLVVQLNKHDLADQPSLDVLHRKLGLQGAAIFETVATEPGGPLRTLTTISKRVLHVLKEQAQGQAAEPAAPAVRPPEPAPVVVAPAPTIEPTSGPRPAVAPAAPAVPTPPVAAAPPESAATLMEEAILSEADEQDEFHRADRAAVLAEQSLDKSWGELEEEAKADAGGRFGRDMRIVSVGIAEAVDERSLRIPLVLGDPDGATVSLALTVALDPLVGGEDP